MANDPGRSRARLQAIDDDLRSVRLSPDPKGRYLRVASLLTRIVDDFLAAMRLAWVGEPEPYDPAIGYSSRGPELVYIDLSGLLAGRMMVRRRVIRAQRRATQRSKRQAPDRFQAAFVVEFQGALAMVMASMGRKPDRLIDYVSHGLVEQGIAGALAAFGGGSEAALLFHQDLLRAIKRLLLSTYEGRYATVAVIVLPSGAGAKLQWNRLAQDGIRFLCDTKIARVLSDGRDSVFVLSADGEFFGLFERQPCLAQLPRVTGVVEWQIRPALTLGLKIDGRRCLELFGGAWRYVDDDEVRRALIGTHPSFAKRGPNRLVWELAFRLSESRHGGLVLVVDRPHDLVKAGCCEAGELNLLDGRSRVTRRLQRYGLRGDRRVSGISLPHKDMILEQFLDKTLDEIGVERLLRLAVVDGAIIVRSDGRFCGFGIILALPPSPRPPPSEPSSTPRTEGSRTRAALLSSRYGIAVKISADGPISIYKGGGRVFP